MENWSLYVDLGYGIPQYAVMEILRDMRENAGPARRQNFQYSAHSNNGFRIKDTLHLGLCLLANARCVGLELSSAQAEANDDGSLTVYFNKR